MAARASSPKEAAAIQMMSSGLVSLIAMALLLFGSPAQPGERRNALFLAFEEMLGYHVSCGLFVGIGVLWFGWATFRFMRASKAEAAG